MRSIVPKIVVHVHNRIAKVRILFSKIEFPPAAKSRKTAIFTILTAIITIHIYIIINNIPQNFFSPVKRKNYAMQNPW